MAAVNPYLPGLDLSLAALLAIALGVFLSAGTWDAVLERTAPRRVLVIGTAAVADVDARRPTAGAGCPSRSSAPPPAPAGRPRPASTARTSPR